MLNADDDSEKQIESGFEEEVLERIFLVVIRDLNRTLE